MAHAMTSPSEKHSNLNRIETKAAVSEWRRRGSMALFALRRRR
jgi:hypothetical protein